MTNKTCPPKSQMSLNLSKTKHIKEQETTEEKQKLRKEGKITTKADKS